MINPTQIGRRVSARRKKLNKTIEQLAYEAKVSIGAVRSLEKGERGSTIRVLGAVAEALGVDPGELVRK